MNLLKLSAFAVLLASLIPAITQARTCAVADDPIAQNTAMSALAGTWSTTYHPGDVSMDGLVLPYPHGDEADTISFTLSGDALTSTQVDMAGAMVFTWNNDAPWAFVDGDMRFGIPRPPQTSEEIEAASGCAINDVMRVIGTTTASVRGQTMDFTWRLIVVDANSMFLIQHITGTLSGAPYASRRIVSLTR